MLYNQSISRYVEDIKSWYVSWLQEGCQDRLAGSASYGRHIPTQGYNITQSSAPDDGHMVA